ncbi:response regulator [Altererythrobacter sp. MF3-039]|uniref:hybrid sensor histidine kinase/response regulator n=1 Tax=Altererythrobacter sp. MF3-039 TaxID=3252901 RepID=UPI00390CA700
MSPAEGSLPMPGWRVRLGLLAAVSISAAVLWLVTQSPLLTASFAGGLVVILLGIFAQAGLKSKPEVESFASPDWSVTAAALEKLSDAVALTDRANRLVCANSAYVEAFGLENAPPNLGVADGARTEMQLKAREAWRDGSAEMSHIESEDGLRSYSLMIERSGRAEDYLLWRFASHQAISLEEQIIGPLTGSAGQTLSRAGIELALVNQDGSIKAAGAGFAERAAGDPNATLAGQDFVGLLRSDDRERIFFGREGKQGTPQTLVHIPLDQPTQGNVPAADAGPSIMALVDSGVGIGGGWEGAGRSAMPQIESLLSALPLGLAVADRDGRFLFANKAFLRAVNRKETGLPQFPTDLVMREDKAIVSDAVRQFGRGPAASGDMAVRLTTQPDEPVSIGLAGIRGLGEAAVLLSLADSTEEIRLRRQVAQATKMQAVGQLAGGVAHDFNNVLTAIIGYCDLMLLRHSPGDSDYDDIQQIKANSNRAASLTRQLLAFSRQQTLRPETVQLPDVVSEVSQLLKRLMGDHIEFTVRHDRELGPVRADPQQLEQVIINLAVNARDAMQSHSGGPGKLSLVTRRVPAAEVSKIGKDFMPETDYTALIVQDTGGGIPEAALGKIFEPFYTTKEQGKGTGLGLSTVYGIVKQSNGFIFADNIVGNEGSVEGARFSVYLPVHYVDPDEEADSEAAEAASASDWSGGGKLLLVEDEDMVRTIATRALTRAGYEVTACADGEEGFDEVKGGGEFDLVVSDVVMPGMDGPSMARAIRELQPNLPILFMSGYAEEQLRKDIDMAEMHFIAKPFSVQDIGDKVAAILASGGKK